MEANMPVLCFPCVVTARDGATPTGSRRIWIKGHDLAALALAAAEQLGASSDACEYLLFSPKAPHPSGVFLEVVHDGCSALVGPMAGPTPPDSHDHERRYSLPNLLAHVGLGSECGGVHSHVYPVTVTYSGIFRDEANTPSRKSGESDQRYRERCAAAEGLRVERACHEGVHVVRYDREPAAWEARDLECLMALAYRCLPTREPRWRESGAIVQEVVGAGDEAFLRGRCAHQRRGEAGPHYRSERRRRRVTPALRYCVHIARGDYAAYLRLPAFPLLALADWLATRRCEILLGQPVVRTEALAEQIRVAAARGGMQ
jgi:hypothetical protein